MQHKFVRSLLLSTVVSSAVCSTMVNPVTIVAEGETNPYYGGWGNCTWAAWQLCYEATGYALPEMGNAGNWYGKAAQLGYSVGLEPRANSIIVWSNHVGYVTAVSEDGSQVYVKEGNFSGGYHEGWWDAYGVRTYQALYGYIYIPTDTYYPEEPYYEESASVEEVFLEGSASEITGGSVIEETQEEIVANNPIIKEPEEVEITYKEVEEAGVIYVEDVVSSESQKEIDVQAKESIDKEDKAQRLASNKEKQGCE